MNAKSEAEISEEIWTGFKRNSDSVLTIRETRGNPAAQDSKSPSLHVSAAPSLFPIPPCPSRSPRRPPPPPFPPSAFSSPVHFPLPPPASVTFVSDLVSLCVLPFPRLLPTSFVQSRVCARSVSHLTPCPPCRPAPRSDLPRPVHRPATPLLASPHVTRRDAVSRIPSEWNNMLQSHLNTHTATAHTPLKPNNHMIRPG